MEIVKTELEGVYVVKNPVFSDSRGIFTKIYNEELFNRFGICTDFKESYYTNSKKNVIRGMHFQKPPYDQNKLVYVPKGKITDVILDLRQSSRTYKKFITIEVSDSNSHSIYIPKGLAHGFRSLMDDTIVVYQVSTVYNLENDSGIRWDSCGIEWGILNPIISVRDKSFSKLDDFNTLW
ncbi:dTDP-4-dehydrorhamnose 3,5-epimerase [Clostridium bowmanii]|uniref:dTDP-4-dehydrorhamnose 3,5-epimerase n=1 Tax=Clostridium bowmanii TaxID=132925 RepID=UPI001C0DFA44|nr:dTDP-4-dehydrorhamnose 3,5-epimerase [Clostridium bowmanii]MBU3190611.1 dTDP-4-dehydrorhamnose 3,5-epimerase [Clostridium bowmanii]MCA1075144.1 dTDP-4-dehydrorhamnose 3,5-epimerase [Clostridium bowmanii]